MKMKNKKKGIEEMVELRFAMRFSLGASGVC